MGCLRIYLWYVYIAFKTLFVHCLTDINGFGGISGKDKKRLKKNSVHDYVMSDEGGLGHLISISKMAELNLLFF